MVVYWSRRSNRSLVCHVFHQPIIVHKMIDQFALQRKQNVDPATNSIARMTARISV
jgi:hypothetical protein